MGILKHYPAGWMVDVFVHPEESPTGKRLRVRRVCQGSHAEALALHTEIDTYLRTHGRYHEPARATPKITTEAPARGTLMEALALTWSDPEDGWSAKRDGLKQYQNALMVITILGGQTRCATITREHYNTIRTALAAVGNAPATVTRKLQALHRVLYFAELKGWIKGRPKWKRAKGRTREFTFDVTTRMGVEAYLKEHCPDAHDAFVISIETGMRQGEVLAIRGLDAKPRENILRVLDSKNGEPRTVILPPRACSVLTQRIKVFNKGELFPALTQARLIEAMQDARESLGQGDNIDFVFHAARHTALSTLSDVEVSLSDIMNQAGHKTPSMSLRYIHRSAQSRKTNILRRLGHG